MNNKSLPIVKMFNITYVKNKNGWEQRLFLIPTFFGGPFFYYNIFKSFLLPKKCVSENPYLNAHINSEPIADLHTES